MADIIRHGNAVWVGDLRGGNGKVSTASGALTDLPYSFPSRFEHGNGTNPEELIAAAHASCFSMALSNGLSSAGHTPTEIRTQASLVLARGQSGFKVTRIHLATEGIVPGIDEAAFKEAAETAKKNCPISVLLGPGLEEITLDASLSTDQSQEMKKEDQV